MTLSTALLAYLFAASLLTITPGLDTALVVRTASIEGPRRGALAALGIGCGCLAWGVAVALGLGVLLAASNAAYALIKLAGAAYLVWLGITLIVRPRTPLDLKGASTGGGNWWLRGLLNNLLNPKVGVFYVSFLPQFVPAGFSPAPFILLLAVIHFVMGLAWAGALILATAPIRRFLDDKGAVRWLDRVTGGVFVTFGVGLALDRR
ncbi:MAG TPA: LysE family translocator [Caulobacteraceae bacterium]|nr:LysE family translocator [Caulobacteraceae bacterium]